MVPARGAGGPDPDGGGGASRAPARRRPRPRCRHGPRPADYYLLNVPRSAQLLQGLVDEGRLPARVEGYQPAFLHPGRAPAPPPAARLGPAVAVRLAGVELPHRALWGARYRIEIYVRRRSVHGYYVLPFLLGEDLVAIADLKADRKAGVLRVRAAWVEDRSSVRTAGLDEVAAELAGELGTMAAWMGLAGGVAVEPRGDLAALLPPPRDRRRRPVTSAEIELRTSPRSCGPKCAVRLAGVTARRRLSALGRRPNLVGGRRGVAAHVLLGELGVTLDVLLRHLGVALHVLGGDLGLVAHRGGGVLGGRLEVLGRALGDGLRLGRASSSTGRTCWSTRWCSFCVAGRRLDTSIPAPRAMSPAASGLPSVAEVAADGAPVTLSTAVEATSAPCPWPCPPCRRSSCRHSRSGRSPRSGRGRRSPSPDCAGSGRTAPPQARRRSTMRPGLTRSPTASRS